MNFREIAQHMVNVHGSISSARNWAELHAASHVGRNTAPHIAALAHWDAVSQELKKMQAEKKA